jgi:serine protease Do
MSSAGVRATVPRRLMCALTLTVLTTPFGVGEAQAQAVRRAPVAADALSQDPLEQFSRSVEGMVGRVSPAVVQILVNVSDTGGGPDRSNVSDGIEQRVASGVIVAPDGYIVTNAHVTRNAYGVKVRLVPAGRGGTGDVLAQSFAPVLDADIVGTYAEADLALLKVNAQSLPTLAMGSFDRLRQGQVVFAFGSPNGLQNSVTMGVVSSVARQLDPDSPMLYIQTDASINPGNSGGPLVNTAGEFVGLNTFISTQSGGNEGLGFAVPAVLVGWVYDQLRARGYVTRPVIGAGLQTITPQLASALHLTRSSGVIISDILPDSPALSAGLKLNDIVLSIDGHPMDNIAAWTGLSFQHTPGVSMAMEVLRGDRTVSLRVTPVETEQPSARLAQLSDLSKSQITSIGVMGMTLDERAASSMSPLRLASGVVVVARVRTPEGAITDLRPGDLIHEVNGASVYSVDSLKAALLLLKSGSDVALLVERGGQMFYSTFSMP